MDLLWIGLNLENEKVSLCSEGDVCNCVIRSIGSSFGAFLGFGIGTLIG